MSASFFVVTCPCGEAEFPVDPGKVPDEGVHARCSVCSTVFMVERPAHFQAREESGAAGATAAGVREDSPSKSFDAYFEPVFPGDAEGGSDRPDEAEATPTPVAEPEVGLRMEVEIPAPPAGGTGFGRRDPHDKARRLARVLVSDMVTYHRERHARALAAGTLPEDFDEEIRKSWEEYVNQVGRELAEETTYFRDALNDILAGGRAGGPELF